MGSTGLPGTPGTRLGKVCNLAKDEDRHSAGTYRHTGRHTRQVGPLWGMVRVGVPRSPLCLRTQLPVLSALSGQAMHAEHRGVHRVPVARSCRCRMLGTGDQRSEWGAQRRSLIPVCPSCPLRKILPRNDSCERAVLPRISAYPSMQGPWAFSNALRQTHRKWPKSTQRSDMGSKSPSAVAHGVAHQGDRLTSMSHIGSALPIMLRTVC